MCTNELAHVKRDLIIDEKGRLRRDYTSPAVSPEPFAVRSHTVMILSFRTDRPRQTVQTQIRLLLEEQSDQGLHCLQFRLHLLGALLFSKAILFKFWGDYSKFLGVRIFRIFTVI